MSEYSAIKEHPKDDEINFEQEEQDYQLAATHNQGDFETFEQQDRDRQRFGDRDKQKQRAYQDESRICDEDLDSENSDDDFVVVLEDADDFCDNFMSREILNESTEHGVDCDCPDCDDVDYLHGFIDGKPYGIK